jgi:hypothetical protein
MLAAAHLLHRHERNGSRHHVRFVAALAEPFVLVVCPRDGSLWASRWTRGQGTCSATFLDGFAGLTRPPW